MLSSFLVIGITHLTTGSKTHSTLQALKPPHSLSKGSLPQAYKKWAVLRSKSIFYVLSQLLRAPENRWVDLKTTESEVLFCHMLLVLSRFVSQQLGWHQQAG